MKASDIPKANRLLATLEHLNNTSISWEGVTGRYNTIGGNNGERVDASLVGYNAIADCVNAARQAIAEELRKMGVDL